MEEQTLEKEFAEKLTEQRREGRKQKKVLVTLYELILSKV